MFLYVLQLENNKFYVGKTHDLFSRIGMHFCGEGSGWTKLHPPTKVLEKIETSDPEEEDKQVLKYMKIHGIENVRGGSFSSIILTQPEISIISKMINHNTDKCLNCGESGHFVKDCQTKNPNSHPTPQPQPPSDSSISPIIEQVVTNLATSAVNSLTRAISNSLNPQQPPPRPKQQPPRPKQQTRQQPPSRIYKTTYVYEEDDDEDECFRCGRTGHWASTCYATFHANGYPL